MSIRRTIIVLEDSSCSREWFHELFADKSGWAVLFAENLVDVLSAVESHCYAMVLVPEGKHDGELAEIVMQVQCVSGTTPVVYLVHDIENRGGASQALRAGVNDVVFGATLEQPAGFEVLRLAWTRQELELHNGSVARQLLRCQDNLQLLDELTAAVTSTINYDELISRALDVFASICPRGRASFCELIVSPDYLDDGDVAPPISAMRLRCIGNSYRRTSRKAEADTRLVDSFSFFQEASERELIELIMSNEIKSNVFAADKLYPALNTLWDDVATGHVTLVPVWSSGQALGLLTIYSGTQDQCSRLFRGDEALRAMARVFGSTLQNAQLYEEVDAAYQTLQRTQSQLVHSEKFAAMGVLSAEIAHEFNNPASFVISNLSVMREYVEMISGFVEGLATLENSNVPLQAEIKALEDRYEIAFLREDLDNLIVRSLSGMQRIHQIVQDLRYFSHDIAQEPGWVDLEQLVSAVLHLVNHEARYRAQLKLEFCGLPPVFSDANKLSQVLLNLFVNAAHSIAPGDPEENFIHVSTRREGEDVFLSIRDSGAGIADDVLPRIFEPFFTTKERGSATGLGLPIVQDILRGLGGELTVSSEYGTGSVFEFRLPIRAAKFAVKKELRESGSYKTPPRSRRTTPVYRSLESPSNDSEKPAQEPSNE